MLTRCPRCRTAFRVTREQLLARDGKVRCGACRRAFNAMGYLDMEDRGYKPDAMPPAVDTNDAPNEDALDAPFLETPALPEEPASGETDDFLSTRTLASPDASATPGIPLSVPAMPDAPDIPDALRHAPSPARLDPIDALLTQGHAEKDDDDIPFTHDDDEMDSLLGPATVSRWSTDASPPVAVAAEAAYPLWPFVLVSLVFALLLIFQMAYHYRGELGRQAPVALRIFSALKVDMPLAKEIEWLSIGASGLSPMTRPGHFQLVATLKNQSRYPQTWPQLEISLTDSYDNILTRRIFSPAEYLPAAAPSAFAPGEALLQLDLDAGDLNPTGYRLYLFHF
ncbi:MAG: DUF3426 domain-containing protein [Zoogloeaceae bacterium]|jgi:predicted Zn finger-like uncharacterized protein|nr:DUF3426 domain-containing protein [Zoogloeaceae bacterium]